MIVERFSKTVIASGIFRFYVAAGFFASAIFFILNAHLFTPLDMVLYIIAITIFLKAISNVMFSLLILLFKLDNKKAELDFNYQSKRIDELLSELTTTNSSNKENKAAS